MRTLFLVLLSFTVFIPGFSQEKKDSGQVPAQKIKEMFLKHKDSIEAAALNQDTLISHTRQLSDEQFRTTLATEKQKQKQIDDENFAMQHRWRSFNFQYNASVVIFILVILIVLTGLFFSGWQFSFTLKQLKLKEQLLQLSRRESLTAGNPHTDPKQPGTTPVQPQELQNSQGMNAHSGTDSLNSLKSELELSTTGIKANSSILGVIILVLSIAFFYLYIMYVYPIKYLSPQLPGNKEDTTILKK